MPQSGSIYIGTSGWNYKHWRGTFYPEGLPPSEWLRYYVKHFDSVEINNSFYQLPEKKTFRRWHDSTPERFVFAVKGSRYITHMKKLKDPSASVKTFLDHVTTLGEKLGVILFQLPPRWKFNRERLAEFLDVLPKHRRYAFEFRDQSWWNDRTYAVLAEHNAAFCIFEIGGVESPREVTTDIVYVRLHGPGEKYQGEYDRSALAGWAVALASWRRQKKSIYCYFDNDQNGYAAKDARKLMDMI